MDPSALFLPAACEFVIIAELKEKQKITVYFFKVMEIAKNRRLVQMTKKPRNRTKILRKEKHC